MALNNIEFAFGIRLVERSILPAQNTAYSRFVAAVAGVTLLPAAGLQFASADCQSAHETCDKKMYHNSGESFDNTNSITASSKPVLRE